MLTNLLTHSIIFLRTKLLGKIKIIRYDEKLAELNSYGQINSDYYDTLSMSTLIARNLVPLKQKQIATNYMVIKKVFGFSAVPSKITNYEISVLKHHHFSTLENSTIRQVNQELEQIKKWSNSDDGFLKKQADLIFEIRVKELKFLYASKYFPPNGEIYDGYRALEKYIEFISN